ncbi:MAG: FKBP-type peptidyl-prolyl cis-trans isomerase SlyD [Alteromonadaceae bacterium]|jgi:FKBP-type peptidyl-prolyl cis-trans isomerase SlyD
MKISENKVVVLHYAVSDSEDTLIDSSYDHSPLSIIQGTGYLIPGLEDALIDHVTGDKFEVEVSADQAYGQREDGYVQTVPKDMFGSIEDLAVGAQLRATTDDGEQTVMVIDMTEDEITVDGNHPLAGIDLKFEVDILEVREATADELAHGHVHSEGGCGHQHED